MFKKILANIGLSVLLVVLCFPMTYLFSLVYKNVISHPMSLSFWGLDPYLFTGFLMSVMFLFSVYFVLVFKRLVAIIFFIILNFIMLSLFWGVWVEDLFILIVSSLLGYLLAELLKFSYKKLKK